MNTNSTAHQGSPFHTGEQALQARVGNRAKMEQLGRRVIRDHLPEPHRQFYAALPYLYVASVDAAGRPWASMLSGEPGFITTPNNQQMEVAALPLPGDPLADNLAPGKPLGMLGLDFSNRRRNRANGHIGTRTAGSFTVAIDQSFGNCPKYIRKRELAVTNTFAPQSGPVSKGSKLGPRLHHLVTSADTLFIATRNPAAGPTGGADLSHRGGKRGFVRVSDGDTLSFPDFRGNGHFNTFGNLQLCDGAGLLFVDFASGDVLQLTGHAEVIWQGQELARFAGAERMVRFHLTEYVFAPGALSLRFNDLEASPFVASTGDW